MMTPMEQQFVDVVAPEIYLRRFGRVRDTAIATHGGESRDDAAKLLGMLVAENKASIEEIVEALRECLPTTLDVDAFFRAIAREALGKGRASDAFKELVVPRRLRMWGLIIPRLEGAQS